MKNLRSIRFVAFVLVLVILICSLPLTAFAADEVEINSSPIQTEEIITDVTPIPEQEEFPDYLFENLTPPESVNATRAITAGIEEGESFSVEEGATHTISLNLLSGDTVVWSYSEPVRATVNNAGVVTGVSAGAAIIYATVSHLDGTKTVFTHEVLVTLPNGIYKFQNYATGYYIELPAGDISEDVKYIPWTQEYNRNSEFKITYISNGVYSIRSMVTSSMGFERSSSNKLVNSSIGTMQTASAIPDTAEWTVQSNLNGYYIHNTSSQSFTITAPIGGYGYNYSFSLSNYLENSIQTWNLIKQNNYSENGVDMRNTTNYLPYGSTFQFTATMYSSYGDTNGQHGITWSVINGTGSASISQNGTLSPISGGNVWVRATYRRSSTEAWVASWVVMIVPLSGYELDYEPELWNYYPVQWGTNCYAYALNNQVHPYDNELWYMQPGEIGGLGFVQQSDINAANTVSYVESDADILGFTFEPIGKYQECSDGHYKVALVIAPGVDYHWYRQNSDGTWSHKLASGPVTKLDASDNVIYDPETADRNHEAANYTVFVGFFEVSPLNEFYTLTSSALLADDSPLVCNETSVGLNRQIDIGMTYSEVTKIFGLPTSIQTSLLRFAEYELPNGELVVVEYARNEAGALIVVDIKNKF